MRILGIETSCDETAAAVVEIDDKLQCSLLSNVVASSMDLHIQYGGVVPEIAARSHIESITPVINEALVTVKNGQGFGLDGAQGSDEKRANRTRGTESESRKKLTQQFAKSSSGVAGSAWQQADATDALWDEIDGIAATYGAGLSGSLLIGVLAARTLAITKNKPLYAINHVEGHVYANFLTKVAYSLQLTAYSYRMPERQPEFPMLALIVSGGHSQLAPFRNHFDYALLGQTQDDAIGEAFDKVAKMLGLPYPGGPSIGKKAQEGDSHKYELPKAKMPGKYDFSFSGPKTAVLRLAQQICGKGYDFPSFELSKLLSEAQKADIAASFERTAIETVVDKTVTAFEEFKPASVAIAGGVAASPELRRQLSDRIPLPIQFPDMKLCTDNGAMIATLGAFKAKLKQPPADPYKLEIDPNLSM